MLKLAEAVLRKKYKKSVSLCTCNNQDLGHELWLLTHRTTECQ